MAKIENISLDSLQFTQDASVLTPVTGNVKIYAKSDNKVYSKSSDDVENVLTNDTRYKGLRLAKQIVLTEAATTIEINTDSDGNPLNSELGGELLIYLGTNANITNNVQMQMQINGDASHYWYNALSLTSSILIGFAGTLFSQNRVEIGVLNQNVILNTNSIYRNSAGGGYATYGGGMTTPQTAVTAIKLFLASGTFPAGTVVEWHERG